MITPIAVDLVLNIIAFSFGLYTLFFKMCAFKRCIYTPKMETLTIFAFMLGWSVFGFKAFVTVFPYSFWLSENSWQGAWSYTLARALFLVGFVIAAYIFGKRAETERCERNCRKLKQHAP